MAPRRPAEKTKNEANDVSDVGDLHASVDCQALLRRIFSAVEREASENAAFQERLALEIAEHLGRVAAPAETEKALSRIAGAPVKPEPESEDEDEDELGALNPIAIVDQDGPEALRDRLRFIRRKDPLARLAKRYALDVPQKVLKKQLPVWQMIDAIIEAAQRRAREQMLSAG